MMTTIEKLAELREKMKGTGVDAYVITTDDFHASEYVGAYFREREYMSGFTGSAGTLVVLPDTAALFTEAVFHSGGSTACRQYDRTDEEWTAGRSNDRRIFV